MPPAPISQYLAALRQTLKGGDATERSYYPALKALLECFNSAVEAVSEPRRRACGAPDFHVRKGGLPIGHLEAKDLGASLDDAERSEQIAHRYRPALPNLILTNFLEFRWYVRGEHRRTVRLGEVSGSTITTSRAGRAELADLLAAFLSAEPQGADNARDLATRLARLAHEIRNVIVEGFAREHISADTADLRDAVRKELVPDLDEAHFADLFAQTLAYGFFAAWVHHPEGAPFERSRAAADIPKTSPFLRRIFDIITGPQLDEEPFAGYVDDLVQLLRATDKAAILEDFLRATGREDPVVHFYETFLQAYDPRTRELRGVYYTPEPVVSYMVRSVDHLLKTRFGLPNGLADTAQVEYEAEGEDGEKVAATGPRVLILDPACGTGTFLYEIVSHIRDRFIRKRQAGAWSSYVREHLLPRLFGFELLMAPYAMAHLKLGMQLAGHDLAPGGTGALPVHGADRVSAPPRDSPPLLHSQFAYDFASEERLGVFLTNTLEEAVRRADELFGIYRVITQEANAAAEIKAERPIMVVIGNPPYSGHSANRSWERKGGKRVRTFIGKLLQDYYQVDGKPLGERNPKWLQDDYVKFIRFGQWRIEETAERTEGGGILALITNHSYLDNPTFRGMRQQLMEAFSEIYLLDLHGNARKKEVCPDGSKDENVFDIQQGVAIAIFVLAPGTGRTGTLPVQDGAPPGIGENLTITRRHLPHWQLGGSTYFITFRLKGAVRPGTGGTGALPVQGADRVSALPGGATPPPQEPGRTGALPVPGADRASALPLRQEERAIVRREILYWHGKRWNVHALTVMPDHVHVLATPLEQSPGQWHPLSPILQSVKYGSALKINRLRGRRGSLWQAESFDRIVRDQNEFDEKANYILGNASRAGLTPDGWEYDGFWCEAMDEGRLTHPGRTGTLPVQGADRASAPPQPGPRRARVFHADLWGLRRAKEAFLAERSCEGVEWQEIHPQSPSYLFVPQQEELREEYGDGWQAPDIMPVNSVGIVTARDRLAVAFSREELDARVDRFLDPAIGNEEVRQAFLGARDKLDVGSARQALRGADLSACTHACLFRPFDTRFVLYHDAIIERARRQVMRHMLAGRNVGIVLPRRVETTGPWQHCFGVEMIVDHVAVSSKTIDSLFPLYLYPEEGESAVSRDQKINEAQESLSRAGGDAAAQARLAGTIRRIFPEPEYPRWPNLNPLLLADLEARLGLRFSFPAAHTGRTGTLPVQAGTLPVQAGTLPVQAGTLPVQAGTLPVQAGTLPVQADTLPVPEADGASAPPEAFGPEDVFHYIYAVLHSPTYRARYAEFLKRDFPRIPFTCDPALFRTLAGIGRRLVALHLLEADELAGVASALIGEGDNTVQKVRYEADQRRVCINRTQHFADVPPEVWEFRVGGYQVCDKWLKDRKGRRLSYDDQVHYTRVTVALHHTLRLMEEVDAAIPRWPIG